MTEQVGIEVCEVLKSSDDLAKPRRALSPKFVRSPRSDAIRLPKLPSGAIRLFCTFLKRLGFRCHRRVRCRVPAFSTLSTPSTVLVLNSLGTSLIWRYLASRRFWHAICFLEKSAIA
jgi:hypothetical protein